MELGSLCGSQLLVWIEALCVDLIDLDSQLLYKYIAFCFSFIMQLCLPFQHQRAYISWELYSSDIAADLLVDVRGTDFPICGLLSCHPVICHESLQKAQPESVLWDYRMRSDIQYSYCVGTKKLITVKRPFGAPEKGPPSTHSTVAAGKRKGRFTGKARQHTIKAIFLSAFFSEANESIIRLQFC